MPVRYDTALEAYIIDSAICPDCDQPFYDSGCDASGCNGLACQDCGTGCDLDFVDAEDGGRCATALAEESEGDREVRHNAERVAFGLPPVAAR